MSFRISYGKHFPDFIFFKYQDTYWYCINKLFPLNLSTVDLRSKKSSIIWDINTMLSHCEYRLSAIIFILKNFTTS